MAKTPLPWCIRPGSRVRLKDFDPSDTRGLTEKEAAVADLERNRSKLAELQERLYAENRRAVLVILQGMDAAGKDGTIEHVFHSVNPVGCQVHSFTAPSDEERDHDFLWRVAMRLPRYGNIGIFNRSHYEDVLAVRVRKIAPRSVWEPRYEQINCYEKLLCSMGTRIVKFFLHIDRDEQRERLLDRLRDPNKAWKYQPGDLDDRKLWNDYQHAYEDVLERCSTEAAPWHIVPANKKWVRNALVAQTLIDVLEEMDPKPPKATFDWRKIKIPK